MAITYPLSMPATPGFNRIRLAVTNIVGFTSSPFTAQTQVQEWPGEFWTVEASLPPMQRDDAETWIAFLVALRGQSGTFLIGDPTGATPRGVASGTPKVNGAQTSGSKTLATKGWTPSVTGILQPGDYLQLGSGASAHLHKVLTNANSDVSGNVLLDIFPRLREDVADNATIVVTNTKGVFHLLDNTRTWDVNEAKLFGLAMKAIEAI